MREHKRAQSGTMTPGNMLQRLCCYLSGTEVGTQCKLQVTHRAVVRSWIPNTAITGRWSLVMTSNTLLYANTCIDPGLSFCVHKGTPDHTMRSSSATCVTMKPRIRWHHTKRIFSK